MRPLRWYIKLRTDQLGRAQTVGKGRQVHVYLDLGRGRARGSFSVAKLVVERYRKLALLQEDPTLILVARAVGQALSLSSCRPT